MPEHDLPIVQTGWIQRPKREDMGDLEHQTGDRTTYSPDMNAPDCVGKQGGSTFMIKDGGLISWRFSVMALGGPWGGH